MRVRNSTRVWYFVQNEGDERYVPPGKANRRDFGDWASDVEVCGFAEDVQMRLLATSSAPDDDTVLACFLFPAVFERDTSQ
jgi:hypothetical protein